MEVREPLSRQRALTAAMALADTSGLAALTMRRLAAELGVEAMSLYHHVPGKEGLLDGLADLVVTEIVAAVGATPDLDWRPSLRRLFLLAREVMLRHPWAPGVLGSRRALPPALFTYYDEIVGTLVGGGVSYRIAHRALHAFGSLALGFAQEIFSPATAGGSLDAEPDLSSMPHIVAMVTAESHDAADPSLGWCDSQTEFEFTLDLILDGSARQSGQA